MAPALQQYLRLGSPPLPSSPLSMPPFSLSSSSLPRLHSLAPRPPLPPLSSGPAVVARAVALNANAQTRERQRLKEQFAAAYKRCCTAPMEGVSFTVEDFLNALDKYDFDIAVGTKIIGGNESSVSVIVESLHGFIPFSQILSKSSVEELLGKELPLKFMEVDEERSRLVLSNCKAVTDRQPQFGIASVVTGTVQRLKPYGAFVDVGGLTGLLHISQISYNLVPDVSTVLQPGDILKVMILSHDIQNGRVSLSTKKLEPTPGDMIHNPKLVFEKADEMGQIFRQKIGQAEEIARADALRAEREPLPVVALDVLLQQITAKGGVALADAVCIRGGKVGPTGTSSIRSPA